MPLCPLCFRSSISADDYWCSACGQKLNRRNVEMQRQARLESLQFTPESIALALRITEQMQQPKLLTGPPPVLAITWEPSQPRVPQPLLSELKGNLSRATDASKPVLARNAVPLPQREAQWAIDEADRVAALKRQNDEVDRRLRERLANNQAQATANGRDIRNQKATVAGKHDWLTLPELGRIQQTIESLKATKLVWKQENFDKIFVLQKEALDYIGGVQACLPTCATLIALFSNDADTATDFAGRWEAIKRFINSGKAEKSPFKLSEVVGLRRLAQQCAGMRLAWKAALDLVDARLDYMVRESGFGMNEDSRDVEGWRKKRAALVALVKRDPMTVQKLNDEISALSLDIERVAKEREKGRQNAELNRIADEEKRNCPTGGKLGTPVYWTTLSSDKKELAKCVKHSKPLPASWERCAHHNHPGGNGCEFRLWRGAALTGFRMTAVGTKVFECSAHNSTSDYNYLRVVGIPAWDPLPVLPADFPAAPLLVALLPLPV